jgi:hypothetical protein
MKGINSAEGRTYNFLPSTIRLRSYLHCINKRHADPSRRHCRIHCSGEDCQIQIRENTPVAISICLSVWCKRQEINSVNPGGVRREELLPQTEFASFQEVLTSHHEILSSTVLPGSLSESLTVTSAARSLVTVRS